MRMAFGKLKKICITKGRVVEHYFATLTTKMQELFLTFPQSEAFPAFPNALLSALHSDSAAPDVPRK
jgi:hypothetical protein